MSRSDGGILSVLRLRAKENLTGRVIYPVAAGQKLWHLFRTTMPHATPEDRRLAEEAARTRNWKRWGPYLPDRQWGTVREDYSARGEAWDSFPHDHARSRAYRWGEDGLLGLTDRQCRLCFAPALWNGHDPIL